MNVKLRSVHTVKKCFSILSIWNAEYSLYFALYGIHDFRTLNTELRTAKNKRSKKALLRSHALRTKYVNGVLPGDSLCRFALWSIYDFRTRIVRRLWRVLFRNVKSFLGLSRFENEEYSLCFALWGTINWKKDLWMMRLRRVPVHTVKSFLGLSHFENDE